MYFIGLGSSSMPNEFPQKALVNERWRACTKVQLFLTFVEFTAKFSKRQEKDFEIREAGVLYNGILVHRVVLPEIGQNEDYYIIKVRVSFWNIGPILILKLRNIIKSAIYAINSGSSYAKNI